MPGTERGREDATIQCMSHHIYLFTLTYLINNWTFRQTITTANSKEIFLEYTTNDLQRHVFCKKHI